jgi:hypothetical protein
MTHLTQDARVRRGAEQVDAASGMLHDEQHVHPLEQQRVNVKEVCGEDSVCLDDQELSPGAR